MNQEPFTNEENQEIIETEAVSPAVSSEKISKKITEGLFDVLEMFAWSVFAVLILFTFALRLCRVDGRSMENTLYNGQNLLLASFAYTPEQDDIIVFHLTDETHNMEKTMVKRVIATGGQAVEINFNNGVIKVDGKEYADANAVLKDRNTDVITGIYNLTAEHHYDPVSRTFSATVPKDCVFVMGDNRNNSKDSRDTDVGFVDQRCILGKAVLRLSPFTIFD
ncbi:MAG: signal peptidase I [Clostridia bacterium]|nr:signal peptidase I [Clostridia bacterium]